jgi:hypothetical protein
LTATEDRSKSNQHRLDEVERRQDNLEELVSSVKVIAFRQENVESVVKGINSKVEELTSKPGKRWDSIVDKVLLTIIGAVLLFILAKLGL